MDSVSDRPASLPARQIYIRRRSRRLESLMMGVGVAESTFCESFAEAKRFVRFVLKKPAPRSNLKGSHPQPAPISSSVIFLSYWRPGPHSLKAKRYSVARQSPSYEVASGLFSIVASQSHTSLRRFDPGWAWVDNIDRRWSSPRTAPFRGR